jgi:hypothetical protein
VMLMHPSTLQADPLGRYFVTVSLLEAETIRAMLHARAGAPLFADAGGAATCALHLLRGGQGDHTVVLDSSFDHMVAGTIPGQQAALMTAGVHTEGALGTAVQCLRFMDSQMEFTPPQLTLLLRGIQASATTTRQAFFAAVCSSRRRVQSGWMTRTISKVFTIEHELCLLRQFSVMLLIRSLLTNRSLPLLDAFRAFNASQNGLLTCSEMFGALSWLGLAVAPGDVHGIVRYMDKDGDGLISYDEFRLALVPDGGDTVSAEHREDAEREANGMLDENGGSGILSRAEFAGLAPILMPELAEVDEEEAAGTERESAPELPMSILGQIKVKVKKLEKCDEVWRSAGIATKFKTSIWEDRTGSHHMLGGRNRLRVNLGHFCSSAFTAPKGDRYTLEITDLSVNAVQHSKWLALTVKQVLVHPSRFHRVWGIQTGNSPLFVWEPIPPSEEFIALGMVATLTEEPPAVRSVHCVPREWCDQAMDLNKMIWSDAGASGKPGSLWAVGTLGLLAASQGTVAPGKFSWQLKQGRFTLGESLTQTIASGAIRVGHGAPTMNPEDLVSSGESRPSGGPPPPPAGGPPGPPPGGPPGPPPGGPPGPPRGPPGPPPGPPPLS